MRSLKIIPILFFSLFIFSCAEIQRVQNVLAGDITNYSDTYTFNTDNIASSNHFAQIEDYMESQGWLLTNESANTVKFEFASPATSEGTTGRVQEGTATFTKNNDKKNSLQMSLNLRGNYNFGTREKALEIYNGLRDHLYNQ